MRRKTSALAATVVLVAAAASAGCSRSAENGNTGTAGNTVTAGSTDSAGSAGSGENENATAREKAVKFAECMRANGVSAFPDPNASGELTIDAVANGSSVDTSTPAFEQAMSVCKDLQPPGFTGYKRTPKQQAAALEFAQCIRENGVSDFPDPAPDAPLVDTNRIPSSATPEGLRILNAAMRQCDASEAGVTGGR